jgi:hypothetical protein
MVPRESSPCSLEMHVLAAIASVGDAMAEAASLLLRKLKLIHSRTDPSTNSGNPYPLLGCVQDYPELMDEIVADAYRHRRNSAGVESIGAMREAADELDEMVADAMKRRREEP